MTVTSPVFEPKGPIPPKYTCEGLDVNPPLNLENVPEEAKSLALIMDDPDAPQGTFDHWVVWNIPPGKEIKENQVPGIQGRNSLSKNTYKGPCPPAGTHRYFFKIYALDSFLDLQEGADKQTLEEMMNGHVLAAAELIGLYEKMNK